MYLEAYIIKRKYSPSIWSKFGFGCLFLILFFFTGCRSFERYDPSPVGIYYPDQPYTNITFATDRIFEEENSISFSKPAKIKEVGMMTWSSLFSGKSEVAVVEFTSLDYNPAYNRGNTSDKYFIPIKWLSAHGKISYSGYKTSADYFWESTIIKFLVFLIVSVFIVYTVKRKNKQAKEREQYLKFISHNKINK